MRTWESTAGRALFILGIACWTFVVPPGAQGAEEPRRGGTFVEVLGGDPRRLNPGLDTDTNMYPVGGQIFIIPLTFITESLQPTAEEIKTIAGKGRVVHVRGEYLPLIALHEVFSITPHVAEPQQGIVVLLEAEGKKAALFVDDLVGQHQVVIKTLETNYRKVPGVSAATIMGDGKVAMILDVGALVRIRQS